MTKVNESILQLKADLEELMEYTDKSATEIKTIDELLDKVSSQIKNEPQSEINFSDLKSMIIIIEEEQKKIMEHFRNQVKIITRVSPNLESYFEDWLLGYEKERDSSFQVLKLMVEEGKPTEEKLLQYIEKLPEYIQKNQEMILTGHIIQDNITISIEIIESIMKRLES